jgi:two-component system osmolarity sensor histidine kinase EnvZ
MDRGRARPADTLARQYARWLAGLFIVLELVTASAALGFIFLPMARRAADDLAGLMVLSAQTWTELPPETRPSFEAELVRNHRLMLRPDMPPPADTQLRHGPYLYFLERAFERRLGHEVFFADEDAADGMRWLWTSLPAGERRIGVGFDLGRMRTQPLGAIAVALAVGLLLVGLLSWWLARRIVQPVARLEAAASRMAAGQRPELLPETGPRELADLAHHFNRMARQVRELADARTTLFAGVSHDLRTPLARMRLAIEMLSIRQTPALLAQLERDVEEMNALIGQMLDVARGLSTEAPADIDLSAWLHARARDHAAAARAAASSIAVRCDGTLRVHAPPAMLVRVVDNLLTNALRYAPGVVELVAEPVREDAAKRLRIGVLDRGPGISQAQLPSALRPFHRGAAAEGTPGSFGLGLAIVQQLALANGWKVSLSARDGGGLAAWVTVPASR